jgi:hypothetical protein
MKKRLYRGFGHFFGVQLAANKSFHIDPKKLSAGRDRKVLQQK